MSRDPVFYFVFQGKTAFMPLKYLYPECFVHIKDSPQLYPMKCFSTDSCPPGANCGEILVKRVNYLFTEVFPSAEVLVSYYKYHDKPDSIRGAVFNKDLEPPTLSTLNPTAFRKFQREGVTYQWYPPDEYLFMGGSGGLITVDNILPKGGKV